MANNRTTHQWSLVMYELTLAHLTTAEHERDLEADLRQRRILKVSDIARRPATPPTPENITLSATRGRPAIGRVRTAGR
jgi:hypothetical protein